MPLGEAFSRVLAVERKVLNARVAAARVCAPGFELAQFAAFLEHFADPLVSSIAEQDGDAVHRCAVELFGMAIELAAQGMAATNARAVAIRRVWTDIAPTALTLIAADPVETLGVLTNAAVQLSAIDGVRIDKWLANMSALTSQTRDNRELRALIAVAAWRAGASHYRQSALAAAATLPSTVACSAVGAEGDDWAALASDFARNSWWCPDPARREAASGFAFGQFTGLGGRFSQPPLVRSSPQGFFVLSGEQAFLLVVDAYGATLHSASHEEFKSAPSIVEGAGISLVGNEVVADDRRIALDWPSEGLELACNADSIAVTSPYSHTIRLLPRALP
jgi:hypothetical protein